MGRSESRREAVWLVRKGHRELAKCRSVLPAAVQVGKSGTIFSMSVRQKLRCLGVKFKLTISGPVDGGTGFRPLCSDSWSRAAAFFFLLSDGLTWGSKSCPPALPRGSYRHTSFPGNNSSGGLVPARTTHVCVVRMIDSWSKWLLRRS